MLPPTSGSKWVGCMSAREYSLVDSRSNRNTRGKTEGLISGLGQLGQWTGKRFKRQIFRTMTFTKNNRHLVFPSGHPSKCPPGKMLLTIRYAEDPSHNTAGHLLFSSFRLLSCHYNVINKQGHILVFHLTCSGYHSFLLVTCRVWFSAWRPAIMIQVWFSSVRSVNCGTVP
jgi:hypothetical protein